MMVWIKGLKTGQEESDQLSWGQWNIADKEDNTHDI